MALLNYPTPGIVPPGTPSENEGLQGLLGNPLLQIGLGILGNNQGNYGRLGPALSRGVSQGLQAVQQSQQLRQRQQLADLQLEEYKRKKASEEATSKAISDAMTPASVAPNMSFMDANNQAMQATGGLLDVQKPNGMNPMDIVNPESLPSAQPDFQWNQAIPASFDQDKMLGNILADPAIDASTKFSTYQSMHKEKTPIKVNPGEIVLDPTTMKPVYTAPENNKYQFAPDGSIVDLNNPDTTRSYRAAPEGMQWSNGQLVPLPGYVGMKSQIAAAGRPSVSVTTKQEGEESKAVGKYYGEQYADIQKAGLGASGKINRVQRLNQLLDGVSTGKFTPIGVELASTAQSLGFNIDPKLGNKQAAEALSNEMALELRNPSGGAGMPGAMSDADRDFLKKMSPGIEKTPEGRKLISQSMLALAKRDQEVAKLARDYRKTHGTIDEGFYEKLQTFSDENPLFNGKQKQAAKFNRNMTAKDLKKGQSYVMPNGKTMVWNGLAFD